MKITNNTSPLCSVIIINYNGKDLLARFLPSIERLDYKNYEVIIVDNASTDDSKSFVKNNYPHFKLVESPQNLGTAEGSNIGIPYAKGDYILWLSNDMEVDPLLLRRLIETAESSPEIGICTCKMRRLMPDAKKTDIIDRIGGDVDIFGFPSARGINEKDRGQLDRVTEVFFSFGGAMLIKQEIIDKIGAYDPTFFTLTDDIDLCWRARLAGYKVVAQPKALLYHRVSATIETFRRSRTRYLSERNTLRAILKNYSTFTLIKILPQYFALLIAEMGFMFMIRSPPLVLSGIKAIVWNLINFRDTWSWHEKNQNFRVISDKDIQKSMHKKPFKIKIFKEYLKTGHSRSWQAFFRNQVIPP